MFLLGGHTFFVFDCFGGWGRDFRWSYYLERIRPASLDPSTPEQYREWAARGDVLALQVLRNSDFKDKYREKTSWFTGYVADGRTVALILVCLHGLRFRFTLCLVSVWFSV